MSNIHQVVDANTVGSIASIASIDWGCAVQVMAAASIGSNDENFTATAGQTLYVQAFPLYTTPPQGFSFYSAVYVCIVLSHAVICCLGTQVLARLHTVSFGLNVL